MKKNIISLEERVILLEKEVERLRKLLEAHIRDHGFPPIHPSPTPDRPFKPGHPDVGPPKEF